MLKSKGRHKGPPPRDQFATSSPKVIAPAGPFVVQWGHGPTPHIEFWQTPQEVNRRLNELWDQLRRREAVGRPATWTDVIHASQKPS